MAEKRPVEIRYHVAGQQVTAEAFARALTDAGVRATRVRRGSRADRDQQLLALVEREGEAAFGAGLPLSGNPYRDGGGMAFSGRYARWTLGWRRGEWQTERAAYEAARLGGRTGDVR